MADNDDITLHESLADIALEFKSYLNRDATKKQFVLLYAYNGTGKTRLSMEFKNIAKNNSIGEQDTLYFNAFTEDLFNWDNDLENDAERKLKINSNSQFFDGFRELEMEKKIRKHLERYVDFKIKIDYDDWYVMFSKDDNEFIKVSRGEENIFIWCTFLAVCELVLDDDLSYRWVKYIYIDDPISSLDDNNVITLGTHLIGLLNKENSKNVDVVISSHHHLFFNVMYNELRQNKRRSYFLHKKAEDNYLLKEIKTDSPFFHHIAMLVELKTAVDANDIKTYHFNVLRGIMERTASFFGYSHFSKCIVDAENERRYKRALNLLSHGAYALYPPVDMIEDNKVLFRDVFYDFITEYDFVLPEIFNNENVTEQ